MPGDYQPYWKWRGDGRDQPLGKRDHASRAQGGTLSTGRARRVARSGLARRIARQLLISVFHGAANSPTFLLSLLPMTHQIHNYLLLIFATFGVAAGAHSVAGPETAFVFKDQ